jgi:hypothetical protein
LHTGTPGASHRGRQYLPAHTRTTGPASALIDQTTTDLYADIAGKMGGEAAVALGGSLGEGEIFWGVFSPKLGVITKITTLSVDNKMDTQRRREAQLAPTYTAHNTNIQP